MDRCKSIRKKFWKGFKFEVQNDELMNLDMVYPEFYEGIEGYGNNPITESAMKTVIADWVDMPNRKTFLQPDEVKWIRKFTSAEQREIFGYTIKEFSLKL